MITEPLHIVTMEQITSACPEQYAGTLSDGSTFYARYRYGSGRLDVSGVTVATVEGDDYLGGSFEDGQLKELFDKAGIETRNAIKQSQQ